MGVKYNRLIVASGIVSNWVMIQNIRKLRVSQPFPPHRLLAMRVGDLSIASIGGPPWKD